MIVADNYSAEQGFFLLDIDFFINNSLNIKLLPVISYKRFKYKDDYMCHIPASTVLPSFLYCLLIIYKHIYLY